MNIDKIIEAITSDKAIYSWLIFFGIFSFICGFLYPLHWAFSSGCFAGIVYMYRPKINQNTNK